MASLRERLAVEAADVAHPGRGWRGDPDSPRRPIDRVALVVLPILANAVLAIVVWTHLPPGATVGPDTVTDPIPIGPVLYAGSTFPVERVDDIIATVRRATDLEYACKGPWVISGHVLKWACRTPDSLVVIVASPNAQAFLIEATWFGFDPARTHLAAWAAAVHRDRVIGAAAAAWVDETLGSQGERVLGGVQLDVGGARGAMTLVVRAESPEPPDPSPDASPDASP